MDTKWNYSELSRIAKLAGGPEKLIEQIRHAGETRGALKMLPAVVVAAAIGLVPYLVSKYKESQEAGRKAEEELIQGIKDYDASHPELEEAEKPEKTDSEE